MSLSIDDLQSQIGELRSSSSGSLSGAKQALSSRRKVNRKESKRVISKRSSSKK